MNSNDVRTAVTYLTASVNEMCNTRDMETVIKCFCEAKDKLIEIYKHNVERLQK